MSVDQAYHQIRVLLERHKDNERLYRDKIKEVNLTRSKINDELDILKQTYDKKLKNLEQKLQALKQHNETLSRQNILFKSEIETYQNRLVQKQKIIALLLSQKRETLIIGSSERSKSDKTDSLNANEDEQKHFKKQILIPTKEEEDTVKHSKAREKDHQILAKAPKQYPQILQQEPELEEVKERVAQIQILKVSTSPTKSDNKNEAQVIKKYLKKNQQQKDSSKYFQSLRVQNEQVQEETVQVQKVKHVRPPPIAHKKHSPKQPAKKVNTLPKSYADQDQVKNNNHNFNGNEVTNNNSNLIAETQDIEEIKYIKEKHEIPTQQLKIIHNNQEEINENLQNQEINHQNHLQFQQQHQNIPTSLVVQQDTINQQPESELMSHFNSTPFPENNQEQLANNNFLSHFTNTNEETPQQMSKASMSPKPLARKKKGTKKAGINSFHSQNFDGDHSINSSDFFNQLGKQEPQPQHNLDIEESSIDHIDRDNSLLSNQHPYFVEEKPHFVDQEPLVKTKPVKMTKKKGKRDQIKVADPSLFQ